MIHREVLPHDRRIVRDAAKKLRVGYCKLFQIYAAQDPHDEAPQRYAQHLLEQFVFSGRIPEHLQFWLIDLMTGRVRKVKIS